LKCPVEVEYVESLGKAVYTFASASCLVLGKNTPPNNIRKVVDNEMTAGKIGERFSNAVRNM